MDAIIAKYNSFKTKNHLEFEIRILGLTKNEFKRILGVYISNGEYASKPIETSIVIIDNTEASAVKTGWRNLNTSVFNGKIKVSSLQTRKRSVMMPIKQTYGALECNFALSEESDVGNPITNMTNAIVRYKSRVSFTMNDKWRMDATLVYQSTVADVAKINASIKDERLVSREYKQLFEIDRYVNQYALEFEYIGKHGKLEINDVREVLSIFSKTAGIDIGNNEGRQSISQYGQILNLVVNWKDSRGSLKRALPQVLSMTRNDYYRTVYPLRDWYVTDKADGIRCLVLVYENGGMVMLSDKEVKILRDGIGRVKMIYDCEFVELLGKCFAFDILMNDFANVTNKPFSERLEMLTSGLKDAGDWIVCKKYNKINGEVDNIRTRVMDIMEYSSNMEYETDGLIFVCGTDYYLRGRVYKWKPRNQCTIDFLALTPSKSCLYPVREGYTLYYLFVGIDENLRKSNGINLVTDYANIVPESLCGRGSVYKPIQFSPSFNPKAYVYYHPDTLNTGNLSGRIIELGWSEVGNCGSKCTAMPDDYPGCEWKFHRIRNDRIAGNGMYGNDYKTAENVYTMYFDHFTMESLWLDNRGYFMNAVSKIYKPFTKFTRQLYFDVLTHHGLGKNVIDLASGRGADISRFREIGVERLLCMEVDTLALSECIRRKMIYANQFKPGKKIYPCSIFTSQVDLTAPHDMLVAKAMGYRFDPETVDSITCNMAIHYLCDKIANIRNIFAFAKTMLRPGGIFIFSCMNGNVIAGVLDKSSEAGNLNKISIREGEIIKYSVEKKYTGHAMPVGSTISVLVPFSDKRSEESLVNIEYITGKIAEKNGFKMLATYEIGNVIDSFEIGEDTIMGPKSQEYFADLSAADKEYAQYYSTCVFVKETTKTGGYGRKKINCI